MGKTLSETEYIGMCRREVFDDYLRNRAKKNGATIINGLMMKMEMKGACCCGQGGSGGLLAAGAVAVAWSGRRRVPRCQPTHCRLLCKVFDPPTDIPPPHHHKYTHTHPQRARMAPSPSSTMTMMPAARWGTGTACCAACCQRSPACLSTLPPLPLPCRLWLGHHQQPATHQLAQMASSIMHGKLNHACSVSTGGQAHHHGGGHCDWC